MVMKKRIQKIRDSVKGLEEGFDNLEIGVDELQLVVENTDNLARKNNPNYVV